MSRKAIDLTPGDRGSDKERASGKFGGQDEFDFDNHGVILVEDRGAVLES